MTQNFIRIFVVEQSFLFISENYFEVLNFNRCNYCKLLLMSLKHPLLSMCIIFRFQSGHQDYHFYFDLEQLSFGHM